MNALDKLVDRFLSWPLPDSVCADLCATAQGPGRTGTNLLTAIEAREMLQHVLEDEEAGRDALASHLIDVWVADKGRKIPWAKAVQIIAIVTKQSDAERDRLLRMGDEDGACEMCGRRDPT